MKNLPRAPERDVKSIRNWHYNHGRAAIGTEEQTYLEKSDLIRVVHEERTPLRQIIDSSLKLRTLSIWRSKEDKPPDYDADHVSYYSSKRIDGFASSIIVIIGVIMLITPIWVLQALSTLSMKLGMITLFISVFLLLVSFAMVTKPFEALGATAAYVNSHSFPSLEQRLTFSKICCSSDGVYSVWDSSMTPPPNTSLLMAGFKLKHVCQIMWSRRCLLSDSKIGGK